MIKYIIALLIAPNILFANENCYEAKGNILKKESVHFAESEQRYVVELIKNDTIDLVAYVEDEECNRIIEYVTGIISDTNRKVDILNENEKFTLSVEHMEKEQKIIQDVSLFSTGNLLQVDSIKTMTEIKNEKVSLLSIFSKNKLASEEINHKSGEKNWSVWTYENIVLNESEFFPVINAQYFSDMPISLKTCNSKLETIQNCF